jgi:hypothetical protein
MKKLVTLFFITILFEIFSSNTVFATNFIVKNQSQISNYVYVGFFNDDQKITDKYASGVERFENSIRKYLDFLGKYEILIGFVRTYFYY